MQAVPVSKESFESRLPLPEAWRGVRDDELSKLSGIDVSTQLTLSEVLFYFSNYVGKRGAFLCMPVDSSVVLRLMRFQILFNRKSSLNISFDLCRALLKWLSERMKWSQSTRQKNKRCRYACFWGLVS